MAASPDTLHRLLDALASDLLKRVRDGTATAADLNVARQFLKDNNINAIPTKDNGIGNLAKALPFQSSDEIAAEEHFH